MVKVKEREGVKTRQVAFKLPPSLIRRVRREAADRGVYPAQVVTERLGESYQRSPRTQEDSPI